MRVSTQMNFMNLTYNVMNLESAINKSTNESSSGKKINMPSDDPIGTARAMKYRTDLTQIQQYTDNSNAATSLLNSTDDALTTTVSYLQRVRDLVVEGANNTQNTDDWTAMATEVDKIIGGVMDQANATVGNRYIFAGEDYSSSAYTMRANVTGDTLNQETNPIVIDARNNEFKIKLDDTTTQTISLPPKTYDGSAGHTYDDLTNDIQAQLNNAGFSVPVYVRMGVDNQLSFYAGKKPDDGTVHSLVVKNGPAIKDVGTTAVLSGLTDITLDASANGVTPNYYTGWTVRITGGTGVGESNVVSAYNSGSKLATVMSNWLNPPDQTSQYELVPPLDGKTNVVSPPGNVITLPGSPPYPIDNFYNGMNVNITDAAGNTQTAQITGYTQATGIANIVPNFTMNGSMTYTVTPQINGTAVGGAAASINLVANASQLDGFYNGAAITVTYADGLKETRKITNYTAAGNLAQVDSNWSEPITAATQYSISDTTLAQLGFGNQDTTKEVVGNPLSDKTLVQGSYPLRNTVQNVAGPVLTVVNSDANPAIDFYKNWTMTITDGPGAGQSQTITNSNGNQVTAAANWNAAPNSTYTLRPPLVGAVNVAASNGPPPTLQLDPLNSSTATDFYTGMKVTITSGSGVEQTRTITGYTTAPPTLTLDKEWDTPLPNTTSSYSIDAESDVSANNKFIITLANQPAQEISLDGGDYTPKELAKDVQDRINERGGVYANVRVSVTSTNQLKLAYQDPDLNDNDTPLSIKINSGSTADVLPLLGFADGTVSDTTTPNYEGNSGSINFEIGSSVKIPINAVGNKIFDPIFQHLSQISIDLKGGRTQLLSASDLDNITKDIENVSITQGEVGAKVNRVSSGITRLTNLTSTVTKMQSDVEDIDITTAITTLEMQKTAYQAALQIGAQVLPLSLLNYLK